MPRANHTPSGEKVDSWGRRNRKLADRSCPQCNQVYRPKKSASKYCSHECSWANNGPSASAETWWVNGRGYIEGRVLVDGVVRRVKQHRHVVEKSIGRKLLSSEDVHHINGIKTDNRLENLQVLQHVEHSKTTNAGRVYRRGYQANLSPQERERRSAWMRSMRARQREARPSPAPTDGTSKSGGA